MSVPERVRAQRRRGSPTIPRVAVWGLGKAGCALLRSLFDASIDVVAWGTRAAERRDAFVATFPARRRPYAHLRGLLRAVQPLGCDLLVLAVADDALPVTAQRLLSAPWLPAAVVHLSGARGAGALGALTGRCEVGVFHPLAALDPSCPIPAGTLAAIDAPSLRLRRQLFALGKRLGLAPARLAGGQQARYHAGAVISANLAVALLDIGVELLTASGMPEDDARRALASLLASAAAAAQRMPLADMLTGPVARGDVGTIARHLEALADAPYALEVYRLLSPRLIALARLDAHKRGQLLTALATNPPDANDAQGTRAFPTSKK